MKKDQLEKKMFIENDKIYFPFDADKAFEYMGEPDDKQYYPLEKMEFLPKFQIVSFKDQIDQQKQKKQNQLKAEKNFPNSLSGFVKRYFYSLEDNIENFDHVKQNFQKIVNTPKSTRNQLQFKNKQAKRQREARGYISLTKLQKLFNDPSLKQHLRTYIDTVLPLDIANSNIQGKQYLFKFIPVLKQGLQKGTIKHYKTKHS